jgi:TIR domain-containing protein
LRAGIELIVRRKREELQKNRASGWPSAALRSLQKSLERVENIATNLGVQPADILWEVIPDHESHQIVSQVRSEAQDLLWDAFISHASEDKDGFVRPLAESLRANGQRIWYDEFSLQVGDSLRRSIDKGLVKARYGIVALSPIFFAKEWPQKELDGLVARESRGEKVILPVRHDIDVADIRHYSPTLADRVAVKSKAGLAFVVQELLAILNAGFHQR